MGDVLTLGMDVGSTTSKCLILRSGAEIVSSALIPAGTGTTGPRRALEEALEKALLPENYIGCAAMQTREYLNTVIAPLLSANQDTEVKAQEINV